MAKNQNLYRVKKGEKLSTIAKKFGVTTTDLAAHNNRSARSRLKPGEVLRIPLPPENKLMIAMRKELPRFKRLNKLLVKDKNFRKKFQKNPRKELEAMGIEIDERLLPKEFPVLKLMDDRTFQGLVKKGNLSDVQSYLEKRYPTLVPGEIRGPAHVADAVEAVAVALPAVAVADPVV